MAVQGALTDKNLLFCDGGVIGRNPSTRGGTWAARAIMCGSIVFSISGTITPAQARMPAITNNLTEMLAVLKGLAYLHAKWSGTICSDSEVTLGRIFWGWKWTNIPQWMHHMWQRERIRLVNFEQCKYILLDGHPTKAHLAVGIGKNHHPVSEHNAWCDSACQASKKKLDV